VVKGELERRGLCTERRDSARERAGGGEGENTKERVLEATLDCKRRTEWKRITKSKVIQIGAGEISGAREKC
jgi:hypothetical protein